MRIFEKTLIKWPVLIVSAFSLCFIFWPVQLNMRSWGMICLIPAVIIPVVFSNKHAALSIKRELSIYDLILLLIVSLQFMHFCRLLLKFRYLASFFNIPHALFVAGIAGILSLLALPSLILIHSSVSDLSEQHLGADSVLFRLICLSCKVIIICIMQFFSLQYSSHCFTISFSAVITNTALLFCLNCILAIIIRRWKASLTVSSVIILLYSIANHYTILFHGSPLYFSEFANARTAAAVAFSYTYRISAEILLAILFAVLEAIIIFRHVNEEDSHISGKMRVLYRVGSIIVSLLIFFCTYSHTASKSQDWMPYSSSIEYCGFPVMSIKDIQRRKNTVFEPEGYSLSLISGYEAEEINSENSGPYPDIILILNETLYDLENYTDLAADNDALDALYSIDGIVCGSAVVPYVGGGTNSSEFELLMSKSEYLLRYGAPFTFLSDYQLERSAVSYLKQLGYSSTAIHMSKTNYNRNVAYSQMGFDNTILGSDALKHTEKNGKRAWTDSGHYKDLIEHYQEADDSPQFFYLLTFQNHGGYEQNPPELDTINIRNDFGELTDDIEEFLSSIRLSAEAFRDLTEYFKTVDRDVIICMVGDHAPSFINSLPETKGRTQQENEIAKRAVPYVLWANHDIYIPESTEYVSMVDLLPMMLKAEKMPISPWYKYILELHDVIPIRTANGIYMDKDGNTGVFSAESPYYDLISRYYYMEYNSLSAYPDYREELFELRNGQYQPH